MSEAMEEGEEAPVASPVARRMKLVRKSDGAILRIISLFPGELVGEFGVELLPASEGEEPSVPAAVPPYISVRAVRERMEGRGTWPAMAAILAAQPDVMLKVLTLGEGLDPADLLVRGAIFMAGDDPEVILAIP